LGTIRELRIIHMLLKEKKVEGGRRRGFFFGEKGRVVGVLDTEKEKSATGRASAGGRGPAKKTGLGDEGGPAERVARRRPNLRPTGYRLNFSGTLLRSGELSDVRTRGNQSHQSGLGGS